MSFYVYENWTAEKKAVIHRGNCGHCKNGQGCHPNPLGNQNGRWLSRCNSLAEARRKAKATGRPVREHRCVKK